MHLRWIGLLSVLVACGSDSPASDGAVSPGAGAGGSPAGQAGAAGQGGSLSGSSGQSGAGQGGAGSAGLAVGGSAGQGGAGAAGSGGAGAAGTEGGSAGAGGAPGGSGGVVGGVSGSSGQAGGGQGGLSGASGQDGGGAGQAGAGQGGTGQAGAGQGGQAGASCFDGEKNGTEEEVDCGGSCAPCAPPCGCLSDADCAAGAYCSDCACLPLPLGTALLHGGGVLPLYQVKAPGGPRAMAFSLVGGELRGLDEVGQVLWSNSVGQGAIFGGFDYNGDGYTDAGLARSEPTGEICGTTPRLRTWLDVVDGKSGQVSSLTATMDDICWTFGNTTYPTSQWTTLGVLWGAGQTLAVAPYYATQGNFLSGQAGFSDLGAYIYPSTASYDAAYTADKVNAYAGSQASFITNSHVGNGLITTVGGQPRLVFFTSGRVVQYAVGPLSGSQLVLDTPFLTGGRNDIAGRNYGLVSLDPGDPGHLTLVAGTSATSLLRDMQDGVAQWDPYGQIERHVSRYDLASGAIEDRYISYAHDGNDAYKYEQRVVFPASVYVRSASGPSRMAFNIYQQGRWHLHITAPGSTASAIDLQDWFLWDIRDLDGDGVDEWALSPAHDPEDPDVPGFYFLKWRTVFARWDDAASKLTMGAPQQGVIPLLLPRFPTAEATSSLGSLDTLATVGEAGGLKVLMLSVDKTTLRLPIAGL